MWGRIHVGENTCKGGYMQSEDGTLQCTGHTFPFCNVLFSSLIRVIKWNSIRLHKKEYVYECRVYYVGICT